MGARSCPAVGEKAGDGWRSPSIGSDPGGDGDARAPATPEPPSERFRKADRLRQRSEFKRVQSRGRRVHTPHYVLLVLPRVDVAPVRAADAPAAGPPEPRPARLGITVSKRAAKRAVDRNRIKRVVREVFRRNRELFPGDIDLVVIGKAGAQTLGYHDARAELAAAREALARAAAGGGRPPRPPRRRAGRGRASAPRSPGASEEPVR